MLPVLGSHFEEQDVRGRDWGHSRGENEARNRPKLWMWGAAERPEEKTIGLRTIRSHCLVLQERPGAKATLSSKPGLIILILNCTGFCFLPIGSCLLLNNFLQNLISGKVGPDKGQVAKPFPGCKLPKTHWKCTKKETVLFTRDFLRQSTIYMFRGILG